MQTQQDAELPNLSEHFIFAKTENGWAVKGPAGKSPGDRVKVLKKDGSDTVVKVGKQVSAIAIYTIQREPRQAPADGSKQVPLKVY